MKYRREIDGLRAVAVLPVILMHAGLGLCSGGFLGVDVFFVISGYLITNLIVERLEKGTFSIWSFYDKRMRRILPALYFVIVCSLPLAWIYMLPDDLENYGQSIVATVCFSNNILIYLTSGYWALEATFKPLVHTWSLGVEEQYYLLAPFVIMLAWRLRKLGLAMCVVLLGSLMWAVVSTYSDESFGFLMIVTRAWELAAGALAVYILRAGVLTRMRSYISSGLALLGLLTVVASYFIVDEHMRHPSFVTIPLVLGSVLIILFASPKNIIGRVLSFPILVGCGLISYSAYLWHQPLFAFARISSLEEPSLLEMFPWVLATFLLSFITWKWVEGPFRSCVRVPVKVFYFMSVVIGIGLLSSGLLMHVERGFPKRFVEFDDTDFRRHSNSSYNESAFSYVSDSFKETGKENVLVVGNSFARDFINAGIESGNLVDVNLVYLPKLNPCQEVDARFVGLLAKSDYVIFASDYGDDAWNWSCAVNFAIDIHEFSRAKVVIVGCKNFGWNNNAIMRLSPSERYTYRARVLDYIVERNNAARNEVPEEMYLDILSLLMDDEHRVPVFTPDQRLISQDRFHLTPAGAKYLGELIFKHPAISDLSRSM